MKLHHLLLATVALTGVALADNPLLAPSDLPFHAPRFDQIKVADYQPALEEGMKLQAAEIETIANNPEPPTFDNTLVAMERSGAVLSHVDMIFEAIVQADSSRQLEKVHATEAPRLAAHQDSIYQNAKLFQRVQTVYDQRDKLDPVSQHLLEITYQLFIKAGAKLPPDQQARLRALNKEEASLSTRFHDRLLADTNAHAVLVTDRAELQGLTAADLAAARNAKKKGWLFALENTTQQPITTSMANAALRQRVLSASESRGDHPGTNDLRGVITRLANIRAERAHMLGYASAAAFYLSDQMAKTPDAAE
ncbi:MAG TPA: dipeptidyl carboxypeptidase II, partial [Candidatus Xenobia bacterium]